MKNYNELRAGFETAYIDGSVASSLAYRPQFVSNNYKEGKKVLSSIEDELLKCDQFQISVAFITMNGITPLLQTLKELEKKNIPGEILTTNYLNFSEPRALAKLNELTNITLKMYDVEAADEGFHTKGYIFRKDEIYRIIIGSSNITSAALTSNREWNTKLISTDQGEMAKEIVAEFRELWNSKYSLSFDEFYENYKERYKIIKHQRDIAKQEEVTSLEKYKLQPNSMQVRFITNLKKIIDAGEERALAYYSGSNYYTKFSQPMNDTKYKNGFCAWERFDKEYRLMNQMYHNMGYGRGITSDLRLALLTEVSEPLSKLLESNNLLSIEKETPVRIQKITCPNCAGNFEREIKLDATFADKIRAIISNYGNEIFAGDDIDTIIKKTVNTRNKLLHVNYKKKEILSGGECGFYVKKYVDMYRMVLMKYLRIYSEDNQKELEDSIKKFNENFPQLRIKKKRAQKNKTN